MMGSYIGFKGKVWKITTKLSALPLLIWSTAEVCNNFVKLSIQGKRSSVNYCNNQLHMATLKSELTDLVTNDVCSKCKV